jgi:hypothetical protein
MNGFQVFGREIKKKHILPKTFSTSNLEFLDEISDSEISYLEIQRCETNLL